MKSKVKGIFKYFEMGFEKMREKKLFKRYLQFSILNVHIGWKLNISYIFMNFIDNFKMRTIIEESIISFKFLNSVKVQDDISS